MTHPHEAFIDMVKADPLFAAEGMDIERGEHTLVAIEASVREYESISSEHSFFTRLWYRRHPLSRYALPLPFLRKFMQSERERRRFLSERTNGAAQDLVRAWRETAEEYATSVRRFTQFYRTLQNLTERPDNPELSIQDVFGHVTSPADINRQLIAIQQNVQKLWEDLSVREKLLQEGQTYAVIQSADKPLPPFLKAAVPEKYRELHALELAHTLPFRKATILEEFGPFWYTLHEFDGTPTPHIFISYIVRNNTTRNESVRILVADEYRFRERSLAPPLWHERNQAQLRESGIPYWYQPATNLYTMRDQQYLAEIATLVDARRRPALDVLGVRTQKSSMLDLLLGACLEDHYILLEHVKDNCRRGTYTLDLAWLWARVRTHPSIYFLPFNASVWRLPEKLSMLGSRPSEKDSAYRTADEVLPLLSGSELELVMKSGVIREEGRKRAWEIYRAS